MPAAGTRCRSRSPAACRRKAIEGAPHRRQLPLDHLFARAERQGHGGVVGVDPDAIELTAEQNVLTVRAERHFEPEEGDELLIGEPPQGTFTRQLPLVESLDTESVEADGGAGEKAPCARTPDSLIA